jgi:hypothetical protein
MNKVFNFVNVAVGRALKMMNKTVWIVDLVFSFETDFEQVFSFWSVDVNRTLKIDRQWGWWT